ncbi:hypothetical protein [Mycolicibacterium helvum]|uniref:hypothetical protein n=1 Tax=Mycolicibacterium helvum TaxID=1534349 RepID=UPI0015D157AD
MATIDLNPAGTDFSYVADVTDRAQIHATLAAVTPDHTAVHGVDHVSTHTDS